MSRMAALSTFRVQRWQGTTLEIRQDYQSDHSYSYALSSEIDEMCIPWIRTGQSFAHPMPHNWMM